MIVVAWSVGWCAAGLSIVRFHDVPLCGVPQQQLLTTSSTCARVSSATVEHVFPFWSQWRRVSEHGNSNKPTGVSAGWRWSADQCGSPVHELGGSVWRGLGCAIACSKNLDGCRCGIPQVGALCVSTCTNNMALAAALRLVLFSLCAFMHLAVVSERGIAASVLCVGVFCITMTR